LEGFDITGEVEIVSPGISNEMIVHCHRVICRKTANRLLFEERAEDFMC
jgi:hypothetical protein